MRFNRQVQLGDRFEVKVTHCDPRTEAIHFQEMIFQAAQ